MSNNAKTPPAAPSLRELAIRCARAESLLRRIRDARAAFAYDPGGPSTVLDGVYVVERWIDGHFDGSYWGDILAIPEDPTLAAIIRGEP